VGIAHALLQVAPHVGWRHAETTERRTHLEYAHCLRHVVDEVVPDVRRIRIV
jgi:hypothetical protein